VLNFLKKCIVHRIIDCDRISKLEDFQDFHERVVRVQILQCQDLIFSEESFGVLLLIKFFSEKLVLYDRALAAVRNLSKNASLSPNNTLMQWQCFWDIHTP
jgi:hypothetical protein